jgi:hypothetical protein
VRKSNVLSATGLIFLLALPVLASFAQKVSRKGAKTRRSRVLRGFSLRLCAFAGEISVAGRLFVQSDKHRVSFHH